jgi:pimeloyl-ACP methyl ester carboxylesterase
MRTIERENLKITYQETGTGEITLLFVHGAFINMDYWSAQVDYFKHHYRVITIDLPGHGASGKNRTAWNIHEYGKDVCTLINELGLKNIILIGHSMGGDVILEVATQCAECVIGFIGIDNFKNAGSAMPEEFESQIAYILEMLKNDFANTSEGYARQALLSASTDKAIAERVVADYRHMDKEIGISLISDVFTYYGRERELMSLMRHKMYLLNVDNYPTNDQLLKKYAASGFEITSIKGTCHYPMIENANEFNRLLEEIIMKINGRR